MCIIYTWGVLSTNLGPVFPPFFLLAGIQIQGTTLQIGDDAPIEKAGHEGGAEERGNLPGNPQKRWPSPEVFFGVPPTRDKLQCKLSKTKLLSHGRDSQPEQLLSLYANPANINQVQE